MDIRSRELNGYRLIYLPDHIEASRSKNMWGWVYEHRAAASDMLGRPLREDEEVHHLDENRSNNHPENLLVLTQSQHLKLHGWMRRVGIDPKSYPTKICKQCGNVLSVEQESFCSDPCRKIGARKVERPEKEQLEADLLMMPMVKVGAKYGVSDNAVRKWCKIYGIDIPPRFRKYQTGSGATVVMQVQ